MTNSVVIPPTNSGVVFPGYPDEAGVLSGSNDSEDFGDSDFNEVVFLWADKRFSFVFVDSGGNDLPRELSNLSEEHAPVRIDMPKGISGHVSWNVNNLSGGFAVYRV